jgi:hypothetical protein
MNTDTRHRHNICRYRQAYGNRHTPIKIHRQNIEGQIPTQASTKTRMNTDSIWIPAYMVTGTNTKKRMQGDTSIDRGKH